MKKEIVGILLAGGMGSRLKELTDTIPKPALHFGGKYRIIDFALSNCSNSGLDTVGIITQYEPIELTSYIGSGSAWDLDVLDGGITVLPPYTSKKEGFYWQKGTAHAVYQHLNYLDLYHPRYVLILSTDHIYKMDYSKLLQYHKDKKADLTIACIEVNQKDTSRFGIIEVSEEFKVTSFEEKPQNTESTLASQGIYLFNYDILKQLLIQLKRKNDDELDFGKDVIPYMLQKNAVYAYQFTDYWKDIGTIESLWKTNMDLIDMPERLNLYDDRWPIYSNSEYMPPHHVFKHTMIRNSLLCEGSLILGNIDHSILSTSVLVDKNSTLINTIVMPHVKIGKNCYIRNAIIKMDVTIPDNTVLDDDEITLITEKTFMKG